MDESQKTRVIPSTTSKTGFRHHPESGEFRLEWAVAQSTDNGSDVSPNTDLKFATIPATVGRGGERSLLLR
jgi:hypothetical protein